MNYIAMQPQSLGGYAGLNEVPLAIIFNIKLMGTDVVLLILCPVFAALGVLVSFVLKQNTEHAIKGTLQKVGAYIGQLFIGLVLGMVISLFFVGALNNETTSLARVLALTILLGYQAQNLWHSQEVVIKKIVKEKIDSLKL